MDAVHSLRHSAAPHPPRLSRGLAGSVRRCCTGGGRESASGQGGRSFTKTHRMRKGRIISTIAVSNPSRVAKAILYVVYPRKLLENSWPPMTTFQRMAKMPITVRHPAKRVDPFAGRLGQLKNLGQAKQCDRRHRAEQDLHNHLRRPETRVHHEIKAAERFVGLVDALKQVQHLQAEIDDECCRADTAQSCPDSACRWRVREAGWRPCTAASPRRCPTPSPKK